MIYQIRTDHLLDRPLQITKENEHLLINKENEQLGINKNDFFNVSLRLAYVGYMRYTCLIAPVFL